MQTRQNEPKTIKRGPPYYLPLSGLGDSAFKSKSDDGGIIDWTDEVEALFFRCFVTGTTVYRPVGINKHFNMLCIHERFSKALGRKVSIQQLWDKLDTMYNLEALDKMEEPLTFPEQDFKLGADYDELIQERVNESVFDEGGGMAMGLDMSEYDDGRLLNVTPTNFSSSKSRSGSGSGKSNLVKRRVSLTDESSVESIGNVTKRQRRI